MNDIFLQIVSLGEYNAIEELITKQKININYKNKYGDCAIIVAARGNYTEMIELLVSHGADLNAQDGKGRTAKGYALYYRNQVLLDYIEKNGKSSGGNL